MRCSLDCHRGSVAGPFDRLRAWKLRGSLSRGDRLVHTRGRFANTPVSRQISGSDPHPSPPAHTFHAGDHRFESDWGYWRNRLCGRDHESLRTLGPRRQSSQGPVRPAGRAAATAAETKPDAASPGRHGCPPPVAQTAAPGAGSSRHEHCPCCGGQPTRSFRRIAMGSAFSRHSSEPLISSEARALSPLTTPKIYATPSAECGAGEAASSRPPTRAHNARASLRR